MNETRLLRESCFFYTLSRNILRAYLYAPKAWANIKKGWGYGLNRYKWIQYPWLFSLLCVAAFLTGCGRGDSGGAYTENTRIADVIHDPAKEDTGLFFFKGNLEPGRWQKGGWTMRWNSGKHICKHFDEMKFGGRENEQFYL